MSARVKKCTGCGVEKQISEFNRDSKKKDGLNIYCKFCHRDMVKNYYKRNSDKKRKYNREYYENNKERCKGKAKEWYKKNEERGKDNMKKYHQNNREKEIERSRKYRQENSGLFNYYKMKRRSIKKKSIPKWADLENIKEIYQDCPEGKEVDHIIPLQGENVCGLHCEDNLQYLTPEENRSKSNSTMCEG